MRAFTRYEALLAIIAIHVLGGCSDPAARCWAIAPGTPVSSLAPLYGEDPCGAPSSDADVALIQCCLAQSHTDGGCGTDCAALAPYGSAAVTGEEYSGGECSDYHVGWSCEVWYRNGKVVVAQACCID